MKIRHVMAALVLGQMLTMGQASATCAATDVAGTWYVHGAVVDYTSTFGDDWLRCKLVVNSSGTVSTSLSQCFFAGAAGTPDTVAVTAGALHVSTACAISSSSLTTSIGKVVVKFGQMDKSHNSFTAVGYQSNRTGNKFVIQAVKQ